jgi:hypothetical protein
MAILPLRFFIPTLSVRDGDDFYHEDLSLLYNQLDWFHPGDMRMFIETDPSQCIEHCTFLNDKYSPILSEHGKWREMPRPYFQPDWGSHLGGFFLSQSEVCKFFGMSPEEYLTSLLAGPKTATSSKDYIEAFCEKEALMSMETVLGILTVAQLLSEGGLFE